MRPMLMIVMGAMLLAGAGHPQQSGEAFLAQLASRPKLPAFEGTLTTTNFTAAGAVTVKEKLLFAAPDKFRLEMVSENLPPSERQVTLCVGRTSQMLFTSTRRLRRWDYNLLERWARGLGGPANVAVFGAASDRLAREFQVGGTTTGTWGDRPTVTLTLVDKAPQRVMVQDFVRTGGGFGSPLFFLPFKRPLTLPPARVALTFDRERGVVLKRENFDERGQLLGSAEATAVRQVGAGVWFPTAFEVKDRAGQVVSKVVYEVTALAAPPADGRFSLPPAADTVAEDAELESIAEYRRQAASRPNDPEARFNYALALWRHTEDLDKAFEQLAKIVELKPRAVVPRLAAAEVLIAGRRYRDARIVYEQTLNLFPDHPGLRAALGYLALRTYDRETAVRAFEAAAQEQPPNLTWHVALGELYQQQGDFDRARQVYERVIRHPDHTQTQAKLFAVEDLALMTIWREQVNQHLSPPAPGNEGEGGDSPFLHKLRGDLLLHLKRSDEAKKEFTRARQQLPDNSLLGFSIARSLERKGELAAAEAEYASLAQKLGAQSIVGADAMRRLISLYAGAGRHGEAWKPYADLVAAVDLESGKQQERQRMVEAYRKRFQLDALVGYLEARAKQRPPQEEVSRLLLDLYEYYGDAPKFMALLRQGIADFPNNGWWRARLAELLVADAVRTPANAPPAQQREAETKFQQARREIQAAIAGDPQQLYYRAQLAFVLERGAPFQTSQAQRQQWRSESLTTAQRLVAEFPEDPDALTVQATIEADQPSLLGLQGTAFKHFQEALELGKPRGERHDAVYYLRQAIAQLHLKNNRATQAVQQYAILFQAAPNVTEEMGMAGILLATYLQAETPAQVVTLLTYLMREPNSKADKDLLLNAMMDGIGIKPEYLKNVTEAIDKELSAPGANPYLYHIAGRLRAADEKADEALSFYERAAEALPGDPDLASWVGDAYYQRARQREQEGQGAEEQGGGGAGAKPETRNPKPETRNFDEDYRRAIEWYNKALRLDPARVDDYYWQALAAYRLNDLQEPARLAREMMLHVPNDFRALRLLASLYVETGRGALALEAAREAMARGITQPEVPSDEMVELSLAWARALALEGRGGEAEALYRQIARPQSGLLNHRDALLGLALLHEERDRLPQAIAVCEETLKLNLPLSQRTDLLVRIARLQTTANQKAEATATLQRAIAGLQDALKANPTPNRRLNLFVTLAQVQTIAEQRKEALTSYQQALTLVTDAATRRNIEEAVKQLQGKS